MSVSDTSCHAHDPTCDDADHCHELLVIASVPDAPCHAHEPACDVNGHCHWLLTVALVSAQLQAPCHAHVRVTASDVATSDDSAHCHGLPTACHDHILNPTPAHSHWTSDCEESIASRAVFAMSWHCPPHTFVFGVASGCHLHSHDESQTPSSRHCH